MAKRKLPTAREYIKENFAPKKNSAKKTAENFDKLTKAFVAPKPKAKTK